jgi:hypothetical protein
MNDPTMEPDFGEDFWANVNRRAAHVRELALQELNRAEQAIMHIEAPAMASEAADGNVHPVFTEPFWEEVSRRAHRVRELAQASVAEAEERLLGDEDVPEMAPAHTRRIFSGTNPVAVFFRSLSWRRSDILGFAAALLAVVFFLPQLIAPVWSSAGLQPPKILQFALGGADQKQSTQHPAGEEGGATSKPKSSDGSSPSSPSGSDKAGSASQTTKAADGSDAHSATGQGGATGAAASGAPAPGSQGTSGGAATASPSPAVSPEPPAPPKPPIAPSGLQAVPVDATSIRLSWTDASSDEIAFDINRVGTDTSPLTIQRVSKDLTTFVWTNVAPETKVCFRIRAVGEAASSDWAPSAPPGDVCATTPAAPVEPQPQTQTSPNPATSPSPAA